MPKIRNEKTKHKMFNLSEEVIENIKDLASFEGMQQSEFIEHLVKNWQTGIDPTENLLELQKEKELIKEKMNIIDKKISETTEKIKLSNDWSKQKKIKKTEAIKILKRFILNKQFEEAEKISKVWQRMTGIPAIELLIEAKTIIEETGI